MIEKLAEGVWKLKLSSLWRGAISSNVYYVDLGKKILIDTGSRSERKKLLKDLKDIVEPEQVEALVFTHLHFDHTGNYDLFPNAKLYASKEEIEDFNQDPDGAVLEYEIAEGLKGKLNPVENLELNGIEIIKTPGHTRGSISLWYLKEGILFTGDTLFQRGYGRVDLPTSVPSMLKRSLEKLGGYKRTILAPGH